jgi:tetratricopeptide (TPR) repeat protein
MAYAQEIMSLIQSGRAKDALPLCERYCGEQPNEAAAWFLRAGVQAQLGALDEVVSCCRKAVELAPGHTGAWYNLGVALQGLRSLEASAEAYACAIRLNPVYVSPYINITIVLRRLGRLAEALQYAYKAMRLDPTQPAILNNLGLALLDNGNVDEALKQFDKAIELDREALEPLLNKGLAFARKGDHASALECYQKIVQRDPSNTQAWMEIGNLQRRRHEFDAAIATYLVAMENSPAHPGVSNLVGLALIEGGRPQEAVEWIEKSLATREGSAETYNTLAGARHALGDILAAVSAFERAVDLDPRCAQAHNNLGLLLQHGGDHVHAEQRFREAHLIDPACAEYENNLGTALLAQGRCDEAIATLRSATGHDSGHAAAWNNLGNALLSVENYRENFSEADAAYKHAINLKPDFAEAYYHYGTCLQQQGNYEEAYRRYNDAVELRQDYIEALAGQVMLLERLGRFAEANAILQPLLSNHMDNVLVPLAFGVMARHLGQHEQALELLETIDPKNLDKWARIQRNFLMGDLYDDIGEYGKAFEHYHAGNTEDHPGYSIRQTEHKFSTLKGAYSSDKQSPRPKASNRSALPVFIVGMPRSGTTLLEQILASHPDVYGAGELEYMHHLTSALPKRLDSKWMHPACMVDATVEALDRIAGEYIDHLQGHAPEARRIVDKMPHNFEALGLIDMLFPGAHVLHCRRNPIDTCVSIYFKHFNSFHPYASDLKSLGLYYRQYEKLMEYWKRTLDVPILDVRYEEVVADQEGMSRRILEFVGLEWDERCLNYHKLGRTVKTASYDQVRKPIYTKSVERWRRYEDHLGPLLEALGV